MLAYIYGMWHPLAVPASEHARYDSTLMDFTLLDEQDRQCKAPAGHPFNPTAAVVPARLLATAPLVYGTRA